jgi:uncharacterized protein (TIRG00374 family)
VIWFKRLITLVSLAILLYLFWPLVKEVRNLGGTFREASLGWLLAALTIQLISYSFLAGLNLLLLRPFPGQIGFWRMMTVLPAMAFIEVTVPSAGASGVVLRARLLGKNGFSAETSSFTVALETMLVGVIMAGFSLVGLVYMIRMGEIHTFQIISLSMICVVLFAAGGFAFWYGGDRQRVKHLSLRLNEAANHWREKYQRKITPPGEVTRRVDEFYDGLVWLRRRPTWPYVVAAFGRVSLDIACLAACFAAFNYVIAPGLLLTGYGLMLLISGLASLPGGLGMADLSLSVIYARLGAPGAVAIAAALSYRLIAWWLVRFVGFFSWQVLEAEDGKSRPGG